MNNMKLRVCLTEKCNFLCKYCRPGGEGTVINSHNQLTNNELITVIKKLVEMGIEALRLTGGEPLLRKNFFELASELSTINGLSKMTMVTNGSLLNSEKAKKIAMIKFKSVTISLDTLDPAKYKEIVGVDCLNKVIDGILLLKNEGVKVKINSVISRSNIDDVYGIVDFCRENKLPLKLLDLVGGKSDYWLNEYVKLHDVIDRFKSIASSSSMQYQDEGLGTPEQVFFIDPTNIVVKDSTLGTCYANECRNCELYPCQSGVVSLILTHNGFLKYCSLSDKFNVDVKPLIQNCNETFKKVENLMKIYNSAKFENVWYGSVKVDRCINVKD